jgi:DNA polymerase-3 subunit delta
MYKKEFDSLSKIPNNLLLFGNSFYLKEYEEKLLNKFKNANIQKFYYDEFDFDAAKTHLSESSLFGDVNLLILKHNKIPPNLDKLIKVNKNNYFLFFYYSNKTPKNNPFGKNFVRFFEPNLRETVVYIDELSKKLNLNITQEAKLYLAKSISPEFLKEEITKLSIYSNDISLEDVKQLVFLYKEESFEDLIVSVLKGEDFSEKLNTILEVADFKRIIPAFIRYVRELYEYHLYFKKTGLSSLEGFLGYKLPSQIERQRIELSLKFKEKDYYELLKHLLNFELKMRNSEKNKEAVFWEAMTYLKVFNSF